MFRTKSIVFLFCTILVLSFCVSPAWSYWVWSPEQGKFISPEGEGLGAAEEQYDYAMKFYKEKNLKEAEKQLDNLLKKYPSARISAEAQYRLGTIYEEQGEYEKAYDAYKTLIESYPQSDRFSEVIEREFKIGNLFLSGQKAKLVGLEILPAQSKAVEIFKHIVANAPYGDYGDQSQFHLALTYKKMGRYQESLEAFQELVDRYPQSELAAQARYQLAETSFQRSRREFRDQRALEEASRQVDRFLAHYPDTVSSEEAAKIRQQIDEKNAEKNYKVGVYYEKQKYLQSALIYYEDVAAQYAHTKWGQKAAARVQALKDPASYLGQKEEELTQQMKVLEAQIRSVGDSDENEKKRLEGRLEHLKKQQKGMDKQKKGSIESREDDLKRRESELKEKFKNLGKKKKLMKDNPSEDFKKAIERWEASLMAEEDELRREREQLKEWRGELGVKEGIQPLDWIPFVGEDRTELEEVRSIDAKKLYKLSAEKKSILEAKEGLYKHHGEIQAALETAPSGMEAVKQPAYLLSDADLNLKDLEAAAGADNAEQLTRIRQTLKKIESLEQKLDDKKQLYEKRYGSSAWLAIADIPKNLMKASSATAKAFDKTFEFLNPFDQGDADLEDKSLQELLELKMHLKEQLSAQQNLVDTLSNAFNTELALQEQKRLLATLEREGEMDPGALRKSIKKVEKEIRGAYEEIDDRHERKKELLKELEALVKARTGEAGPMSRAGSSIAAPFKALVEIPKGFIFGMRNRDQKITDSAKAMSKDLPNTDRVVALKEDIELESLMIEAKHQEIFKLQRKLEMLKARASLEGGMKFRSSLVNVPYRFIGEALESARRIVPKKNRQEILIERLNEETHELERIKGRLAEVDKAIQTKDPHGRKTPTTPTRSVQEKLSAGTSKDEAVLKAEIEDLMGQLETQKSIFSREKAVLESKLDMPAATQTVAAPKATAAAPPRQKQIMKELKATRDKLKEIIRKEEELEQEEAEILEKRIEELDKMMSKVRSKALQQDLLVERNRMEERISQIQSRQSFLTKELERFQLLEHGARA